MDRAACRGDFYTVKWFHKYSKAGCTRNAMFYAARNGHLNIVKWLHKNRKEGLGHRYALDEIASQKHLDVLKWLHKNRLGECSKMAMCYAALNGDLDTLIWLHENRTEGCTPRAMKYAIQSHSSPSNVDVVKWLYENRPDSLSKKLSKKWISLIYNLYTYEQFELWKWFVKQSQITESYSNTNIKKIFNCDLLLRVARDNQLHFVKFICENKTEDCSINKINDAINEASIKGHNEIIQYLQEYINALEK